MKAKLEFDLDDTEDRTAHLRCIKSTDMAIVLFEITHNLQKKLEHRFESQPQPRDEFDGLEEAFREIRNLLEDNNININELIQ